MTDIIRNLIFENACTDRRACEYVDGETLCISAGTADRFTKEGLEKRIAYHIKSTSAKDAAVTIESGFDILKEQYREDEATSKILCKFVCDETEITEEISVKIFIREIIYDNDLGSDCDDGGATAMLVRAHRDGYCKVLAITSVVHNPWTPMCLKKVCEYFGVYDIEIGENRDRTHLSQFWWYDCSKVPAKMFYNEDEYPTFESNVPLIRRLLASSNGNVTVITTGGLSTMYPLMMSEGDEYSPLSGDELFREKVGHYVCGGGKFPDGAQESNFLDDPTAVDMVINRYLSGYPVTFVGAEVSGAARSGTCFKGREDYILLHVYRNCQCAVMNNFENDGYWSWDQGVVYFALHGTSDHHFDTVENVTVVPKNHGGFLKLYTDSGCHRYVVRKSPLEVLGAIYNEQMVP